LPCNQGEGKWLEAFKGGKGPLVDAAKGSFPPSLMAAGGVKAEGPPPNLGGSEGQRPAS
jgi:hypothetical protein